MKTLDELSARAVIGYVAMTFLLMGIVGAFAWLEINRLPSSGHAAAWWLFGGLTVAAALAFSGYQVHGWRTGSLDLDTPEKRTKHAAQLKAAWSLVPAVAGASTFIALAFTLSPTFNVTLSGVLAGTLIGLWLGLVFKTSKKGRAMRAARQNPRPEDSTSP